ncbi:MAG: cysteine-rich CWC family protein [Planctomycetota bacterium]
MAADTNTNHRSIPLALASTRCPLCGGANRCAIADGRSPKTCWCMTATVPADLLEHLPAEAVGKACICEACIDAWNGRGVLRSYVE